MHALRKNDVEESITQSLKFNQVAIIAHDFNRNSAALGDMKGLIQRGFHVTPINPDMAENNIELLGMKVCKTVSDVDDDLQIVVVHLDSEWIYDVISDLSSRTERWGDIRTIWLEPAVEIPKKILSDAHDYGWMVVQNHCILAEVMERNISHC